VNGPCIGGGLGLLSACDVAVASSDAFFAFREVRLGITPATISPYVIRKIGERNTRDYFLTGRRMDAGTAQVIGLVNEVVEPKQLDEAVERWVKRFLHSGAEAIKASKQLIARVSRAQIRDVKAYTADVIAKLRGSDEGKEGFTAFFEKRKPKWDVEE
jgi:methylglutaconyl-CoA hydratase